jgi:DNA-binding transcriptional MerR regulator
MKTVKQVAQLAKVVRTLHHYDEIGLLPPSGRSEAGYRLYDERDLERLQQILIYRELDFSLEAIQQLLDDPAFDRARALAEQRRLLVDRIAQTERVIRAIDAALEGDTTMMFEGLEEEAKERWGDTDHYREAMRRTKKYQDNDWKKIKAEVAEIESALAALLEAGAPADGGEARQLVERHRQHIDRWFYPCDQAMHARLAELYVSDARFAAHYDKRKPGLAQFFADAIRKHCR